jgi:hypothetical protein
VYFLVVGKINGIEYKLRYDEGGILSGDKIAIEKAYEENKKNHGNLGMPPSTKSNYLADGNAAYSLIVSFVFDEVISTESDDNEIPEDADI